jgi:hypothetical protein
LRTFYRQKLLTSIAPQLVCLIQEALIKSKEASIAMLTVAHATSNSFGAIRLHAWNSPWHNDGTLQISLIKAVSYE